VHLFEVRELGRARAEPAHVVVAKELLLGGPEFLTVFVDLEPERLMPGLGVKLAEPPRAIAARRERLRQVGSAALVHAVTRRPVAEPGGLGRLATGHDRIARRHADGTRGVRVRQRDPAGGEPVEVGCADVRKTQRSDGVEPLLIGHHEENVGRRHQVKVGER